MQPQQGLNSACSLGDRLACDAAEFEGQPAGLHTAATAAAAGSNYLTELGLALLPLLLLGLASRLWHRRRGHSSTALRGRCLLRLASGCWVPAANAPIQPSICLHLLWAARRLRILRGRTYTESRHCNRRRLQTVPALGSGGVPSSPVSPDRLACGAATQLLPPHPAVGRGATGSGGSNTRGTLLSAIDTAVSLLLLPISLVQTLLRRGGTAAAPATPVAPGPAGQQPTPNSGGRGMHYGLGIGAAVVLVVIGQGSAGSGEGQQGVLLWLWRAGTPRRSPANLPPLLPIAAQARLSQKMRRRRMVVRAS